MVHAPESSPGRITRSGRARTRPGGRVGRWIEPVVLLAPGLAFYAVLVLAPVLLVGGYMFATRGRFGGVEWTFTLENFGRAFDSIYLEVFRDSLLIALAATVLALALGYPVAYAISRLPARWRTVALVLVVVPFWTNFLIRIYAWIVLLNSQGLVNDALLGLGVTDDRFTLLYTPGAVIAGLTYAYLPLMILPIYAAIERFDHELVEASANLGATRLRTFVSVQLPLTLPGVLTGCILVFVPSLGNFVVPELLGGGKTVMIGNLIRDQFLRTQDWPFGAVLGMVVVLLLVLLFLVQAWVTRRVEGAPRG